MCSDLKESKLNENATIMKAELIDILGGNEVIKDAWDL
jgi:hypothetical protein